MPSNVSKIGISDRSEHVRVGFPSPASHWDSTAREGPASSSWPFHSFQSCWRLWRHSHQQLIWAIVLATTRSARSTRRRMSLMGNSTATPNILTSRLMIIHYPIGSFWTVETLLLDSPRTDLRHTRSSLLLRGHSFLSTTTCHLHFAFGRRTLSALAAFLVRTNPKTPTPFCGSFSLSCCHGADLARDHTHLHRLIIPQIQHTDPSAQSRIPPFLEKSAWTSVPLGSRISRRPSIRIPDTVLTSGSRPNRPSRSLVTLTSSNRTTTSPHNCSPHLLLHSRL
jgi:hypothetical protein